MVAAQLSIEPVISLTLTAIPISHLSGQHRIADTTSAVWSTGEIYIVAVFLSNQPSYTTLSISTSLHNAYNQAKADTSLQHDALQIHPSMSCRIHQHLRRYSPRKRPQRHDASPSQPQGQAQTRQQAHSQSSSLGRERVSGQTAGAPDSKRGQNVERQQDQLRVQEDLH